MGRFKLGDSKPTNSGRKKGVRNKKSAVLEEILVGLNFNIPETIFSLLPKLAPEKQADVLLDLMNYLYPKRKAVEHTGNAPLAQTSVNVATHVNHFEKMTQAELEQELRAVETARAELEGIPLCASCWPPTGPAGT